MRGSGTGAFGVPNAYTRMFESRKILAFMKLFAIEYVIVWQRKTHRSQLFNRFLASPVTRYFEGIVPGHLDLSLFIRRYPQLGHHICGNANCNAVAPLREFH